MAESTATLADRQQPLYQQVETFVCRQISDGTFQPGHRLDLSDLVRKTRISRGVVQQALQSLSSRGVLVRRPRSGTYVAEGACERLIHGGGQNVALVMPYLQVPEFARLARTLANTARAHGLDLLIAGTDNRVEFYEQTIRRQLRAKVFGLIIVPPVDAVLPLELLQKIEASNVAVVCCHNPMPGCTWPLVTQDMEHAGQTAAQHILDTGRRAMAFIGYRRSAFASGSMYEGFARVVMQRIDQVDEVHELRLNVPADPERWTDHEQLLPALRQFLVTRPQLDGFCCESDRIAGAVVQILHSVLGRDVPATATVVGNGNYLEYSSYAPRGIVTIDPYTEAFGEALLRQLIAAREGVAASSDHPVRVRGELRATTVKAAAPARSGGPS